jgi:hypothetical protein
MTICWTSRLGLSRTMKCNKITVVFVSNLNRRQAAAELELLFNKLRLSFQNKSSCLAAALLWIQSNFAVLIKSELDVQQILFWGRFAKWSGTKIIFWIIVNLVELKARADHRLLFNTPASGPQHCLWLVCWTSAAKYDKNLTNNSQPTLSFSYGQSARYSFKQVLIRRRKKCRRGFVIQ